MGTTAYPGGVDDFATTSPTNLGDDDSTGRTHSERHDDMEAAMEAVQANAISKTLLDAKGDLIAGSAADTAAKLTVGADHTFVQAMAAESTGLKYGPIVQTYTPDLTAGTTNPTLGTASSSYGRWFQLGGMIFCTIGVKFGTSGTNAGSGTYFISTPVNMRANVGLEGYNVGNGLLYDGSAYKQVTCVRSTASTLAMVYESLFVSHSTPWAWGASDWFTLNLTYEIA